MITALIVIFALSYALIALEAPLGINKSAPALVGAGLLWTIYALSAGSPGLIEEQLSGSLVEVAQIAFFLIGAMTVVEVIDAHDGFEVVTQRLKAGSLSTLALMVATATFFLSAILDNLTTAIIMVSLLRKLVADREPRLLLAGLVVVCANAGGAWSPIGDVTTTMLWIGGQVTSSAIITRLFLPSLVNALVPTAIIAWQLRGQPFVSAVATTTGGSAIPRFEQRLIFGLGLGVLLAVPLFKTTTHLPPFLGILFGLGIVWVVGDLVHRRHDPAVAARPTIAEALTRIDMGAIVFFIGILLSVAVLEHTRVLLDLAAWLDRSVGRLDVIVTIIGLVSAVIDNVPMVAAATGMYAMDKFPTDSFLWEYLAYCAGTGGSILIIGSAAGVAAMGIERIEFLWYLRRIGILALIGYASGSVIYMLNV